MMKKNYIYRVYQIKNNRSYLYGVFTNYKEAKKIFNSIKKDADGYILKPHGYLETLISKESNDENSDFHFDILDYFKYIY